MAALSAPTQKMPTLRFAEQALSQLEPEEANLTEKESEFERYDRMGLIIEAQVLAIRILESFRNAFSRGDRKFIYVSEIALDDKGRILRLTQEILARSYGKVELQKLPYDRSTTRIEVHWEGICPGPFSQEEQQEKINGELFYSVLSNDMPKAVSWIREKHADVNARGPFRRTPLYVVMHHPSQIDTLAQNKADVNIYDRFGFSPLDASLAWNDLESEFVRTLINHRAKDGITLQVRASEKKKN